MTVTLIVMGDSAAVLIEPNKFIKEGHIDIPTVTSVEKVMAQNKKSTAIQQCFNI
jgi:hypothetical protein